MKATCDFCGEKKEVVRTQYGTTRYTRLICKECIDYVNNYHLSLDGKAVLKDDGDFMEV